MNFKEFKDKYQKHQVVEYDNSVRADPMVSVCVQTYQHATFIADCLNGILMQKTNFPFEILLGEDESSDGTREICIEFAKKYPDRIRLFLHHRGNNISVLDQATGRFNVMYNFYQSKGKYIAMCPGDDYWTDDSKLQQQFDFMEANPDYSLCGHNAFIIKDGAVIQESKLPQGQRRDFNKQEIQKGVFILTMTSFFRNIGTYPFECMKILNFDTLLFIYLGSFGKYKYMNSIKPAGYRLHDGGIWSANTQYKKEFSNLHTHFWISKYFSRKESSALKNHHGMKVAVNAIRYLIDSRDLNIMYLMRFAISHKYNKVYSSLHRIKKYIRSKLSFV